MILPPGRLAEIACLLEATAPKPGNVHPQASFSNAHYVDFLLSATALVEPLNQVAQVGVGATILKAVQATQNLVQNNTNLGIILLLTPLAAVDADRDLNNVLKSLTVEDARLTYEAIRLAQPGGLGQTSEQDVRQEPTITLLEAMRLAADRDLIARQYANGFHEVNTIGLPTLEAAIRQGQSLETAILTAFLQLLAHCPDTLIARKRGFAEAQTASQLAKTVLDAGWPQLAASRHLMQELDHWLREFGHSRNPGAIADLVAASLFLALQHKVIPLPWSGVWSGDLAAITRNKHS